MNERLQEVVDQFQMLDPDFRLQMLLEYSEKLPSLPEALHEARDKGLNRIEECQSPVYLWVEVEDEAVDIHADVPEESPTVRGFVSVLVNTLDGASPDEVADLPLDLLTQMGIGSLIGMTRTRGLTAIIRRIKHEVSNSSRVGKEA
jgi:cysteine desulfuration protein SufE